MNEPPVILKKNGLLKCILLFVMFVTMAGCSLFTSSPALKKINEVPSNWSIKNTDNSDINNWVDEFSQPELALVLQEAFAHSPTLQRQFTTVKLAQIQSRLAGADRWPELSLGLGSSRNKRSNTGGFSIASEYSTTYKFSLDLSWEVDLWNRLGNGLKASLYDAEASKADFDSARQSLAANVIKVWVDSIESQQQLNLAKKTVVNFENTLNIVEKGYDLGLYRALDVRLARANLLGAKGNVQQYEIIKNDALRLLGFFLGRFPGGELNVPNELPIITSSIPVGLPSDLLNRRPDIMAAKHRFLAQNQRFIQAKKNRLPSIRLTGSGGTSTRDLKDLVNTDFLVWNFISGLVQPIFQGGRLDALRDQAAENLKQSEYQYTETVLQAFREVETFLSADEFLSKQVGLIVQRADELDEAEELGSEDYVGGLTDINTLLDVQRQAFDARSRVLNIRKTRIQNRVNLYLALGGPVGIGKSQEKEKENNE